MLRQPALGLLLAWLLAPALAAETGDAPEVTHEVRFPELNQQYIQVRSSFPTAGATEVVQMATWTPGSYLIREFSAKVDGIRFTDETGTELAFSKITKNHWQVSLRAGAGLVAEYRVHAGELSVNTSWASAEFVLINGASVFLYTESGRGLPQRVTVHPPAGFSQVLAPLPGPGAGEFVAGDFDELIDSPVMVTDETVHRFSSDGHEYRLVNVGAGSLWDGAQAAADLQAMVGATNAFWGSVPFQRPFWFFNVLAERGGGLEHDHSTVIMGSRWQMRQREDYVKWLSLAAHEYFHAWNVRRLRPRALARYDYDLEQYSSALWLVEGISSYYDNLLLSRARLVKPDEYFKRLALDLHALEMTPGRERISLRQASLDAWIRHYRPVANSVNSTISYYTKGAVLGFVLDTRLRQTSRDRVSLDDVMRHMYRQWGEQAYPDGAFLEAVAELGGQQVQDWLRPRLDTPAELDIDQALDWYGLLLNRHPVNNAAREKGEPPMAGFGVTWRAGAPGLVIESVVSGTSGSAAGLLPEDELLAISGERITPETLDDRLLRLRPGEDVELLIARRGRIIELPLRLEESRPATYEILVQTGFGGRQLRRMEAWLGQSLKLDRD